MKIRNGIWSGRSGFFVYVNTKYGQVVRSRPSRPPRPTEARLRCRRNPSALRSLLNSLTPEQFAAWEAAARKENMPLFRLFSTINLALLAAGEPLALNLPQGEKFNLNPVERLDIRNWRGVITLRLSVPSAPAKLTLVLGVRWGSRCLSVPRTNYVILGRLPKAVRGWSDITDLYVQKFGVPRANSRVFVATRQILNGWRDQLKLAHADVPPPG